MGPPAGTPPLIARPLDSRGRLSRVAWHAIGLVLAALLAYAVWRGYQNPDLLLDWSALRLC